MPIENGKYVNPGFLNNQPPDLDADEVNDIVDALVAIQSIVYGGGYATCSTAAATTAKTAALTGYELIVGRPVFITMTNGNTAASPTLNIEGKGAKPLYANGAAAGVIPANYRLLIQYDGTNYVIFNPPISKAAAATAGAFDSTATAPTATDRLNYGGYFYATRVYNAWYNDYAEYFEKGEEANPGDIVELRGGRYVKSTAAFSRKVAGVVSSEYGHILGGTGSNSDNDNFLPVGIAGRLHVNVTGVVHEGDFIVSSDIPGVGMATDEYIPGTVVGKAQEDKTTADIGKVRILIMNM